MARFSKAKKVKKKGPKGKKARAKAKLERQWGEEATETAPQRKGKSRVLAQQRKEVQEETPSSSEEDHNSFFNSDSDSDDDDESMEDGKDNRDDDDDGTKAFSSLLQTIQKKTNKTTRGSQSDESESEDEDMGEEEDVDGISDESDHEVSHKETTFLLPVDPFTERFVQSSSTPVDVPEKPKMEKMDVTKFGLPHDVELDLQITKSVLRPIVASSSSPPLWKDMANAFLSNIRPGLQDRWKISHRKPLDKNQRLLLPFLSSYADILWADSNKSSTEQICALHILQHVLTSRSRIQRNNKRLKEEQDANIRDQGFTRPTVLVLLPTRGTCYTFVKDYLLPLIGDNPAVEKLERFETEYGKLDMENNLDDEAERRRQKVLKEKGKDWLEIFGDDTNDDDDFRVGMSFVPKGGKRSDANADSNIAVKLFTDFFRSDIIFASPLGLKMTAVGDDDMQADFLSSIEICLMARSDVLMMQNWDHVTDILSILNEQPKNTNSTDFSRVRPYFLDEQGAHWRQIICLSPFLDPLLLSTFKRHGKSRDGQVRMRHLVPSDKASIARVLLPTRQVFQRIPCNSFATQSADRLKYFVSNVLPQLEKHQQKHTLIYVPSYFEFIALRNVLLKREHVFVSVTEYARTSEVSRGRARFLQGRKPWMLYTGRAHFFHRHLIKGARHVIFYGLPEHSEFYPDHVNRLNDGLEGSTALSGEDAMVDASASSLVLFSKYESHSLERIVGSSNCSRMVKGDKSTFLFST